MPLIVNAALRSLRSQIFHRLAPLQFHSKVYNVLMFPPKFNITDDETWLSLVERLLREQEVAGSNPVVSIPLLTSRFPGNFDH